MNLVLLLLIAIRTSESHCTNETCEKKSLSLFTDTKPNFALKGHYFVILTFSDWQDCLNECFDKCVCLSFNFDQNRKTENCELNDATSLSAPEYLNTSVGVTYFEIARSYSVDMKGVKSQPCVERRCQNHCCETAPCQNGGLCHEVCDVNKRRFNCTCAPGFVGHRCQSPPLRSCQEVKVFHKEVRNGIYHIVDQQNLSFPVDCDFTSESGFGWTLIQSYSLQYKTAFKDKALYLHDLPISEYFPEWNSYRLSMSRMKSIRNVSTHWRATCNFPTDGVDFRDYIRSSMAKTHLLAVPDSNRCIWYEFVDIRGNKCVNCTAYSPYSASYDYHIDSWYSKEVGCDFDGRANGVVKNEDNFGHYNTINPAFRCTSSSASTTQFWFGGS